MLQRYNIKTTCPNQNVNNLCIVCSKALLLCFLDDCVDNMCFCIYKSWMFV